MGAGIQYRIDTDGNGFADFFPVDMAGNDGDASATHDDPENDDQVDDSEAKQLDKAETSGLKVDITVDQNGDIRRVKTRPKKNSHASESGDSAIGGM